MKFLRLPLHLACGPVLAVSLTLSAPAQDDSILPPPDDGVLQTTVEIRVIDAVATEPGPSDPHVDPLEHRDPAVMRVYRQGLTNMDLVVFYLLGGTASNGEDYAKLSGEITIPAGARHADLLVDPLADDEMEKVESVVARLVPPVCIAIYPPPPGCYRVGLADTAIVSIRDTADEPLNYPPGVTIVSPEEDAVFKPGEPISIQVQTVDQDGYAPNVWLLADGILIGQQTISFFTAPPDGEPILFDFVWEHAGPGPHVLTALATDELGARGHSPPRRIFVDGILEVPEVNVVATDPEAAEPDPVPEGSLRPILLNPGVFTISRRGGDLAQPLVVYYMLGGTAQGGLDYQRVPWSVKMEGGQSEVDVVIVPIDDKEPEPKETVHLTLMPPPLLDAATLEIGSVINTWPRPYRVGPHDRDTVFIADNDAFTDVPPKVAIVRPANGSVFVAPATIDLVAEAADWDGEVVQVEFFEGEHSLGIAMRDHLDRLYLSPFHLVWSDVPAGSYRVIAVATDRDGLTGKSEPVYLKVTDEPMPPTTPPVVRIKAIDPIGSEGGNFDGSPTITFRIRRDGGLEHSLNVYLTLGGSAMNGEDYLAIRPVVTIPEGHASVDLVITPVADDVAEGLESVLVGLIMPPLLDPAVDTAPDAQPPYLIGHPARAAALILDADQDRPPCIRLGDGMYHLCRPGEDGMCYRIEASDDLQRWVPMDSNQVTEGAIHYVDADATLLRHRFYRVIPEPCPSE